MSKVTDLSNDIYEILRQSESDIEKAIEELLDDQPYAVECGECGERMEFSKTFDGDHDMIVTVKPCENCLRIAVEEASDE
jgi:hypothetical protein